MKRQLKSMNAKLQNLKVLEAERDDKESTNISANAAKKQNQMEMVDCIATT